MPDRRQWLLAVGIGGNCAILAWYALGGNAALSLALGVSWAGMVLVQPHLDLPRGGFWTNCFGGVAMFVLSVLPAALGAPFGVELVLAATVAGLLFFAAGVGQATAVGGR